MYLHLLYHLVIGMHLLIVLVIAEPSVAQRLPCTPKNCRCRWNCIKHRRSSWSFIARREKLVTVLLNIII